MCDLAASASEEPDLCGRRCCVSWRSTLRAEADQVLHQRASRLSQTCELNLHQDDWSVAQQEMCHPEWQLFKLAVRIWPETTKSVKKLNLPSEHSPGSLTRTFPLNTLLYYHRFSRWKRRKTFLIAGVKLTTVINCINVFPLNFPCEFINIRLLRSKIWRPRLFSLWCTAKNYN